LGFWGFGVWDKTPKPLTKTRQIILIIYKIDMLDEDITQRVVHNLAIPGALLFAGTTLIYTIYKYILSLHVSGSANEWVLILNNGKLK